MSRRQPKSPLYVQFCARCYSKWPVAGTPADWCPRCGGVLLAPSAKDTPPEHRNFRRVARGSGLGKRTATIAGPQTPTPHYTETPHWGLQDQPPAARTSPVSRIELLAARVDRVLVLTALVFAVAALAEVGRYSLLLYNRTRLVDSWLVWVSDGLVWIAGSVAPLLGVWAALSCTAWLVLARRSHFAQKKARDPRSALRIAIGCLVPGVNLVMPGVLITELTAESEPRVRRFARMWWIAWVASVGLAVVATLWRRADSLQAVADGVVLYAWTDLAAAGMAALTLALIRTIDGRMWNGRRRVATRLVPAVGQSKGGIEPIRPITKDPVAP